MPTAVQGLHKSVAGALYPRRPVPLTLTGNSTCVRDKNTARVPPHTPAAPTRQYTHSSETAAPLGMDFGTAQGRPGTATTTCYAGGFAPYEWFVP